MSQVSRLWILQRNGLSKFLYFSDFCLLYLQVRSNQSKSEKCQKIEKKLKSEVMTTFLKKFRKNTQIFKSRVSVSEFLMKSRSHLEISTRSRSRRITYCCNCLFICCMIHFCLVYSMRWRLWCFCLLVESYETINHYHYQNMFNASFFESQCEFVASPLCVAWA